jgi:tight adherence protein C
MLILLIAFLCLSAAIFLALEFSTTSTKQIKTQFRRAKTMTAQGHRERELSRNARERLGGPIITKLSAIGMRLSPQGNRLQLARKLQAAGMRMTPHKFLAVKGGLMIASIGVGVGVLMGGQIAGLPIMFVLGAMAFIGPDFFLNTKARKRREEMGRSLPDTLDLLTVSVEAGLGFDAALVKVCEKMHGPLIDEFSIMAREIRMGESRRNALRALSDRCATPDIASFCRSLIQAEELGTSLGRTLRVQSVDIRVKRQLDAEEKAMKAPVKMLFPTVLFIFPAMFIVILGPAFLGIVASLKST